jgi:hypothetical protein
LGEEQNTYCGVRRPERDRGPYALVGMRWWHPDVDHRDVGVPGPGPVVQGRGVAHGCDLVSSHLQQLRQPVAQDGEVFGDQEAHRFLTDGRAGRR